MLFVDDPVPQVIKVREEYHLKIRLRRRNWPKYLSMHGWFVDGNVVGDAVVRYHTGDVYDGPYIDERWLNWLGGTVEEGEFCLPLHDNTKRHTRQLTHSSIN